MKNTAVVMISLVCLTFPLGICGSQFSVPLSGVSGYFVIHEWHDTVDVYNRYDVNSCVLEYDTTRAQSGGSIIPHNISLFANGSGFGGGAQLQLIPSGFANYFRVVRAGITFDVVHRGLVFSRAGKTEMITDGDMPRSFGTGRRLDTLRISFSLLNLGLSLLSADTLTLAAGSDSTVPIRASMLGDSIPGLPVYDANWYGIAIWRQGDLHGHSSCRMVQYDFVPDSIPGQWVWKGSGASAWCLGTDTLFFQRGFPYDFQNFIYADTIQFFRRTNAQVYEYSCTGSLGMPIVFDAAQSPELPDTVKAYRFRNTGIGWRDLGNGSIETSGLVLLNDYLRFRGVMRIDTVQNKLFADGLLYVYGERPNNGGFGRDTLRDGGFNFSFGCGGLRSLEEKYLNKLLFAGFPFDVDSISFMADTGVRVGITVKTPFKGGPCGTADKPAFVKASIAPLEITRSGWGGALTVSDVGFYWGFCIKELGASYYSKHDSLNIWAKVKTPGFLGAASAQVDAGLGWVRGDWDALSLSAQLSGGGGIPIGTTGLMLTGVRGSASGWNYPPFKFSFGGTSELIEPPNLLQLKGDLSYQEPSLICGNLEASMYKTGDVWQIVGSDYLEIDWDHYVKIGGSMQAGSLGNAASYFLEGNGYLSYTWNPAPSNIEGWLHGVLQIPKLAEDENSGVISDFCNTFLPISLASAHVHLNHGLIKGNVDLLHEWITAHVVVDLNRSFGDNQFIDFGEGAIMLKARRLDASGNPHIESLARDTIIVPAQTSFAVIRFKGRRPIPASTIIDPAGGIHAADSTGALVRFYDSPTQNKCFWALKDPTPGAWVVVMPQRAVTDTIDGQAQRTDEVLQIQTAQTGKHITVTWNPLSSHDDAEVAVFLDDSTAGYHGFRIAAAHDSNGRMEFDLSDSLQNCSYMIYGVRDNGNYVTRTAYGSASLDNSKTSILSPRSVGAEHHLGKDVVVIHWAPSQSTNVTGYVVRVTDAAGVDSIVGTTPSFDTAYTIHTNSVLQSASVMAVGEGIQGCWSTSAPVVDRVEYDGGIMPAGLGLLHASAYPNPLFGEATVAFELVTSSRVTVEVYNAVGLKVYSVVKSPMPAGWHTVPLELHGLVPGLYVCSVRSGGIVENLKLVLWR